MLRTLRTIAARHRPWVWACWAAGVVLLLSTPMVLIDPAIFVLIADPEMVALFVLVGIAAIRDSTLRFAAAGLARWLPRARRRAARQKLPGTDSSK